MRIIAADESARFATAKFIEAGDGGSAVGSLRSEMAAGRRVDFVLMDFVMVLHAYIHTYIHTYIHSGDGVLIIDAGNTLDTHAWARGCFYNA